MGIADVTGRQTPTRDISSRSPRKHHWWRWVVASVLVIIVLFVVAVGSFIKQPAPAPLMLPTAAASAPVGPIEGTWDVAAGSVAGFRVQQSAVGVSNDFVGRTNAVTGTIAVSGMNVTAATFRVDLTTVKVGGKPSPQWATSLDTQRHPSATFTLAQPMTLSSGVASGATTKGTANGQLTMHGTSRPVTLTMSYRGTGAALQFAGSTPVNFSDWGIRQPQGYGFLGSLANHGEAEVLLVLHRR